MEHFKLNMSFRGFAKPSRFVIIAVLLLVVILPPPSVLYNGIDYLGRFSLLPAANAYQTAASNENGLNNTFPDVTLVGPSVNTYRFGFMVTSGDFNHDGYADLATGNLYGNSTNGIVDGTVSIFYGTANGLKATPDLVIHRFQPENNANFGRRLVAADFNNDTYADLAVASPFSDGAGGVPTPTNANGDVQIFYGSATGLRTTPAATISQRPVQLAANFGRDLWAGDVNGDGIPDVIVGLPFYDSNSTLNNGQVEVFFGARAGVHLRPDVTITPPFAQAGQQFGYSVRSGDVNGDGVNDLIVGAWGVNFGNVTQSGDVNIYYSQKGTGPHTHPDVTLARPTPMDGAKYGRWLAVGDFNGDGIADLTVGSPFADAGDITGDVISDVVSPFANAGLSSNGDAFVYFGNRHVFNTTANAHLAKSPAEANAVFGRRMVSCDVNNDGYSDVLVSAYLADNLVTNNGENAVFYGGPRAHFSPFADVLLTRHPGSNIDASANFGEGLTCGDFNGDGKTDIVMGAFSASHGTVSSNGEVDIFYGGKGAFIPDSDGDGVPSFVDNCPNNYNPDQRDSDGDKIGDVCDSLPNDPRPDSDHDGMPDVTDNCPNIANSDQTDSDGDGIGDVCDFSPYSALNDADADGVKDTVDNCQGVYNPDQADSDNDGTGNVCDPDIDNDGVTNPSDNCPYTYNPDQKDADTDGYGNACDAYPTDPARH